MPRVHQNHARQTRAERMMSLTGSVLSRHIMRITSSGSEVHIALSASLLCRASSSWSARPPRLLFFFLSLFSAAASRAALLLSCSMETCQHRTRHNATKHGQGRYDCNEAKQNGEGDDGEPCRRADDCLCGLNPNKYKTAEDRGLLLRDPAKDWASAISWWGSECVCDPATMIFNDDA